MSRRLRWAFIIAALAVLAGCAMTPGADDLRINQLQFVGSHNSYKRAMSPAHFAALQADNPQAAASLSYEHLPIQQQLDLGLRKLEFDVFTGDEGLSFPVGHVQVIDMNSHCPDLRTCLSQVRDWSDAHPRHVPIWISFNAKDQQIEGLPDPRPFDIDTFARMDEVLESVLGDRLIRPQDVREQRWPKLADARGRLILILDESGAKRDMYWPGWAQRPMFTNAPEGHPAAAVMIVNDPVEDAEHITRLVQAGYLVRTRADADTREARSGDFTRREAAFASGAQAVSTDYYVRGNPFGTPYWVAPVIRCNPVTARRLAPDACSVLE